MLIKEIDPRSRFLNQFAEGQAELAKLRQQAAMLAALENLYHAVENNCADGELWRMRHELSAAAEIIRQARQS